MVSAFIFDAWGTLLRPTARPWERFHAVASQVGLAADSEAARAAFDAAQGWLQQLGGLAAVSPAVEEDLWHRFYSRVLDGLGIADADGALTRTLSQRCLYTRWCEPYPEVPAVVAALADRYPLALITNAHPSILEALTRFDLGGHFRAVVTAAQVGVRKPHPRLFAAALEALTATPAATVYVDDDEANVEAAQRFGMRGFVIDRSNGRPSASRLRSLTELLERRLP